MKSVGSASIVDDEFDEYPHEDEASEDLQASSINSVTSKVRGRRRIPEKWSRVHSLEEIE